MIADRLRQIVDMQDISPRAFALKVGTSSQVFGTYLKGTAPNYKVLCGIVEEFSDINAEWLLTGKGEMLKSAEVFGASTVNNDRYLTLLEANARTMESQQQTIAELTSLLKVKGGAVDAKDVVQKAALG